MGYMGQRRPARSHDTLGAIIDALSERSESEWKAGEAQRVWERPATELLKFTAPPCRMAAAYFRVLHFHSHRGSAWLGAGIEPGRPERSRFSSVPRWESDGRI
jgi:hypothetical protein